MTITGFHWASLGHDPVMVLFISRSAWAPRPPSLFEVPSQGTSPGRVMVMLLAASACNYARKGENANNAPSLGVKGEQDVDFFSHT